jgi:DNA-binding transcriptional regulator YhcF (GntR family)
MPLPNFRISRAITSTLWLQIIAHVITALDSGELVAGERLPTPKQLGLKLGVSESAVKQAYIRLARTRHLIAANGVGYFAAAPEGADAADTVRGHKIAIDALRAATITALSQHINIETIIDTVRNEYNKRPGGIVDHAPNRRTRPNSTPDQRRREVAFDAI